MPRHPLTAAVQAILPGGRAPRSRDYLTLLDDRLDALAALAAGGPLRAGDLRVGPADRALARRFLAAHEGAWDDGDENLVRGYLDRWLREGARPEGRRRARPDRRRHDAGRPARPARDAVVLPVGDGVGALRLC